MSQPANRDIEHLRVLSVFHYVLAGLTALFSLFPILHLLLGLAMVSGVFNEFDNGDAPPEFFGWLFIIFPLVFIAWGLATAIFIAIAGRKLAHQTSYTFCLICHGD